MQIFKVKLAGRHSDCSSDYYFTNLPTREEVKAAIESEKVLAPEYEFFYDQQLRATSAYEWPETWSYNMSEIGHAIDDDIYVRIKRCIVVENKKSCENK